MRDYYLERNRKAIAIADEIWNGRVYTFEKLVPSMLDEQAAGVYIIATIEKNEVLYVGRTTNIRRRLYTNHLQGNKSTARLKKYLVEDSEYPDITSMEEAKIWLKKHCYFKFIERDDYRERGQIEGVLGYMFHVKYIENEH